MKLETDSDKSILININEADAWGYGVGYLRGCVMMVTFDSRVER